MHALIVHAGIEGGYLQAKEFSHLPTAQGMAILELRELEEHLGGPWIAIVFANRSLKDMRRIAPRLFCDRNIKDIIEA